MPAKDGSAYGGKKAWLLSLLVPVLVLTGCFHATDQANTEPEDNTLTVYAYDSLTAEWGLIPAILNKFKEDNQAEVEVVSFSDTGAMLNQLILEKDAPKADVAIGLDNVNFPDVVANDLMQAYIPVQGALIDEDLLFDNKFTLTPFDFGYVGFVYDSEAIDFPEPVSLMALASSEYKDQVIIEQAGLSSPGTQLLLWTKAGLSEDDYDTFWNNMAENVLTVTPDWSTAYYAMFMEGEAPIVLSYLTSPAYHIEFDETDRYRAVPIEEGYIRQVEGAGVVKGNNSPALAEKFVDYMLTPEVQDQVPYTQWMFPVLSNEESWPASYQDIIIPTEQEILTVPEEDIKNNFSDWLAEWNKIFKI